MRSAYSPSQRNECQRHLMKNNKKNFSKGYLLSPQRAIKALDDNKIYLQAESVIMAFMGKLSIRSIHLGNICLT